MRQWVAGVLGLMMLATPSAAQELRGHGGPVRAVAISPDGMLAVSGSFDTSAIVWGLAHGTALAVLRHHEASVNAVIALPDGRFATGGEDGKVALWRPGQPTPEREVAGTEAPVGGLAVSRDGQSLAVAGWDGRVQVHPLGGGAPRVLTGHQGPVSSVAFASDGAGLITAGHDGTLRFWPAGSGPERVVRMPTPVNAVAVGPDGSIAIGSADGQVRLLAPDGTLRHEVEAQPTPIVALALSPDGRTVAAAGLRGAVMVIDSVTGATRARMTGPGLPVWSLAFTPDGSQIITGGGDRLLRRWEVATGRPIGPISRPQADTVAADADPRGAEVFRACVACHTLTADDGNRAGPTLHGVFGRRIATAPGYQFSDALRGMDIVWTAETISRLFEIGPTAYTPGTKMPEQVITDPEDRAALIRFLDRTTR
ncbi:MAG: hypothetical protein EAZ99_02950 [Alphaproteobacteria bacterium]|nr:MAG: hypothetical protein EAZ99_02950 [Alphaproteobacteria bacterium]